MKTCPVCGARCFDDMAVCYGCLHDFSRAMRRGDRVSCKAVRGEPCFDDALDVEEADEPARPVRLAADASASAAKERIEFDPPWFAASPHDGRSGETPLVGGVEPMEMAVPMVTVVRREDALPNVAGRFDANSMAESSSFVLSVPKGGRVLLCAR
ncbi:MAG: hypothetical protein ACLUCU_02805 [Slackia sp.]